MLAVVSGKLTRYHDPTTKNITKIVKQVLIHPKYNDYTYENDIALLHLEKPIQFDKHIGKMKHQLNRL